MEEKSLNKEYLLNYFNKHGKIELCRLIFAAADKKYTDNSIENLTDSDTELGFTPFLQVSDSKIPLISVISRFLAREFDLAGDNNIDMAKTDAISQHCMLLVDSYYKNVFTIEDEDSKKVNYLNYIKDDVENTADTVENLIKLYSKQGDYCVGNKLSYADLFVFEMARNYFPKEEKFTSRFPNIYKIKSTVEQNKRLSNYLKKGSSQECESIQREA